MAIIIRPKPHRRPRPLVIYFLQLFTAAASALYPSSIQHGPQKQFRQARTVSVKIFAPVTILRKLSRFTQIASAATPAASKRYIQPFRRGSKRNYHDESISKPQAFRQQYCSPRTPLIERAIAANRHRADRFSPPVTRSIAISAAHTAVSPSPLVLKSRPELSQRAVSSAAS